MALDRLSHYGIKSVLICHKILHAVVGRRFYAALTPMLNAVAYMWLWKLLNDDDQISIPSLCQDVGQIIRT